jgi:hypothetical protein
MIRQLNCYNKAGSFLIYLVVLAALSGLIWSLLPGIASATNTVGEKTSTLTITVNDYGTVTTAAVLSIGDLQSMNQVRCTYSSVDNGAEVLYYAAEGVLLTDILAGANIDLNNISKFIFTATDNYTRTLTMEYLLDTPRYYYPEIANSFSTQGAVPVQPMLALKSMEFEDKNQLDFNLIDDYYSARLFFGQTEQDLVSNKNFVKWINHIEVFTKPVSEQPPALSADMVNNSVGQPATLTFTDDPAWRAAISDVTVDGNSIPGKYTVDAGTITIDGSVFCSEKDYAVVVKAEGYLDAAVTQHKGPWPAIFTVDGAAVTTSSFTAAELRAMPATTVQFGAETCTGVAVKDILTALNITESSWQAQINVTDAATYHIDPVSVAELLDPANKYLLTYDIDGQPITIGPGNETTLRVYWGIGIVYKNVTGITISAMPAEDSVTLELSKYTAQPGDSVTASGTADAGAWVSIKVVDSAQNIIIFDAVKSDAQGNYSCTFKLPDTAAGTLTVVAGYGGNVANKTITVSTTPVEDTTAPSWSGGSLTADGVSQSGLTLNWSGAFDNVNVTGYKVYQGATLLIASPVTGLSYNVTGLSAGTEYTFTVQAVDAAGNESADGPSVTVTTSSSGGGGGGGSSTTQAVNSTTGEASVSPDAGGIISLGDDVSVNIPAGALKGTTKVDVTIQEVSGPPPAPAGFKLLGIVYEFKVGGDAGYSFNKPVTLTFTFDPASLTNGETPSVYYYDEASAQWVSLGGTISGNTITVSVSHFTRFTLLAKEAALSPVAEQLFSDVPSSYWAGDFIFRLNSLGYISGYPDGTFRPDTSITRAEFATVLVKAFKLPVTAGKVFGDTNSHWAVNYIATAYAAGIATGYNDDSFGPEDLITREQMAVMIVKAAKIKEADAEITCTDSNKISAWAKDAMTAAAQNGIMSGYPDGSFNPQGKATRAEAVAVIANALK